MQNNLASLCKALWNRELFTDYKSEKTNLYRDNFKHLISCHGEGKTASLSHYFKSWAEKTSWWPLQDGRHRLTNSVYFLILYRMLQSTRHHAEYFSQSFEQMLWDRKLRCCGLILQTWFPLLCQDWCNTVLMNHQSPKTQNKDYYVRLHSVNIWKCRKGVEIE